MDGRDILRRAGEAAAVRRPDLGPFWATYAARQKWETFTTIGFCQAFYGEDWRKKWIRLQRLLDEGDIAGIARELEDRLAT
jgi:hypothetical protein